MPWKTTIKRAKEDLHEGKSPTTAAGEFVKEEIEHVRRGKHGARSPKQAIAIGLAKARRAGVPLRPPAPGKAKASTRRSAERAYRQGKASAAKKPAARYSRIREEVLKREPKNTASGKALSQQARSAARRRKATPSGGRSRSRKTTARAGTRPQRKAA